jgi:hypothetical protein
MTGGACRLVAFPVFSGDVFDHMGAHDLAATGRSPRWLSVDGGGGAVSFVRFAFFMANQNNHRSIRHSQVSRPCDIQAHRVDSLTERVRRLKSFQRAATIRDKQVWISAPSEMDRCDRRGFA